MVLLRVSDGHLILLNGFQLFKCLAEQLIIQGDDRVITCQLYLLIHHDCIVVVKIILIIRLKTRLTFRGLCSVLVLCDEGRRRGHFWHEIIVFNDHLILIWQLLWVMVIWILVDNCWVEFDHLRDIRYNSLHGLETAFRHEVPTIVNILLRWWLLNLLNRILLRLYWIIQLMRFVHRSGHFLWALVLYKVCFLNWWLVSLGLGRKWSYIWIPG